MVGEITGNNMANDTLDIASLGTLSPEMYAEQQALNRKQQMAQMLLSQGIQNNGQTQGQMVSGHYVGASPLQSLVPLAQIAAGKYAMDKGDNDAIKLAATLRQEKGNAMNQFRELASNPETMPQAMEYLNKSPYLGDLAKQLNAPRTRKVDEDFIIPGIDGKSIVLDKGKEKIPTSVEEAIYKLDLPRDRSTWTKDQKKAFENYIPLAERIKIQQANLRLADEGIGGVSMGGGAPMGGNPMANVLRGNPAQGGGAPVMPQAPQGAPSMPTMPQSAPQGPVGSPQAPPINYKYDPRLSPKQNRENLAAITNTANEGQQAKYKSAVDSADIIKQVAEILPKSTSGGLYSDIKGAKAYFGMPTNESPQDAQLGVLGAKLVANVPRFKGADSDKDVAQYMAAAGDVANERKPWTDRMGALKTIYELNKKYAPEAYAGMDPDTMFATKTQAKPKLNQSVDVLSNQASEILKRRQQNQQR